MPESFAHTVGQLGMEEKRNLFILTIVTRNDRHAQTKHEAAAQQGALIVR